MSHPRNSADAREEVHDVSLFCNLSEQAKHPSLSDLKSPCYLILILSLKGSGDRQFLCKTCEYCDKPGKSPSGFRYELGFHCVCVSKAVQSVSYYQVETG